MNSEMLGVNFVRIAIAKTDYLIPHINDNDKEPSWDGDIEVYRTAGDVHSKSDLILKVPVQVKGHKTSTLNKNTISFPVNYDDMQNYLEIGGTVFLVVYVDEFGENYRIYYTEFLPYGLKKILRKHNGKDTKTKNIKMKLLPTNKLDITNIFLGFARNMKKQRPAIYSDEVSMEQLIKDGNLPKLSFGFSCVSQKDVSPFDLMLHGNIYIYAQMSHGIELPIEHIESISMTCVTINAPVTANGKQFYNKYKIIHKKDTIELCFGKSAIHTINRQDTSKQLFHFSLNGTLSERIQDEDFMLQALEAQKFEVDGIECPLNQITKEELLSFDLPQRKEHLELLKTVKTVLDLLNVTEELNCSLLNKDDEYNIQLLKSAMLDKEMIPLKIKQSMFGTFNIANLKILVYGKKQDCEKNLYRIYDYNNVPIEVTSTANNGIEYLSSYHVLLTKDVILKASNLNFNLILQNLQTIPFSDVYSNQLNALLLELLKAYDDSSPLRKDILETTTHFAKWLLENDPYSPKAILLLNYYQTIKRSRKLNEHEINQLLQLIENKPDTEEIYVGAYLLLDNQNAATIHFKRMQLEIQTTFRNYPIFHFWKEDSEL